MSLRDTLRNVFWLRRLNGFCHSAAETFGLHPGRFLLTLFGLPRLLRDYFRLKRQNAVSLSPWPLHLYHLCAADRWESSGTASGAYFHLDLLVARRVFERNPVRHVDVGSRIDGFVAHVASFRSIEVFDIRPQAGTVQNIRFQQADLLHIPEHLCAYSDSVSCLHALEHFGLGRYGDPVDIDGHRRGFDSLVRLLKPGGYLYLGVPIGWERVDFNGHRVFSIRSVLALASGHLDFVGFSYVDDRGCLHEQIPSDQIDLEHNYDLNCGCGIFEWRKRA